MLEIEGGGGVCEGISHKYIWQGQRAPCLGAEFPQIQNRLSSRLASDTQKTFGVPLFQLLTVDDPAQWQTAFLKVFFHSQGPRCRHSTQGQGLQARLGPVASALGTGVTCIALESNWGWRRRRRRRLYGTVSMSRGGLPVGPEQCGG